MSGTYASTYYYSMDQPPRVQEWVTDQQQEGVGSRELKLKAKEHFMTSWLAENGCIDEATADVMFVCENGAVLKAHRIALCLTSSYFTNILKHQKLGEMTVIHIPEIPEDVLSMILSLIYKSTKFVKPAEKFVQLMEWLQVFRLSDAIAVEPEEVIQPTALPEATSQNIDLGNAAAASNIPIASAASNIPIASALIQTTAVNVTVGSDATPGPSTNNAVAEGPTTSASAGREPVFKRPFLPATKSGTQSSKRAKLATQIPENTHRGNSARDRAHSAGLLTSSGQREQQHPQTTSGTHQNRTRSVERGRSRVRHGAVKRSSSAGSISIPGDYAGKRFRKLLGSNPRSARLQHKLGQMRWNGRTRHGGTGKTVGHI